MAVTVETWMVNTFRDNVKLALQEGDWRFAGACREERQEGEYDSYDYLGEISFSDVESRHARTVRQEAPHTRRWCFTSQKAAALIIDKKDKLNMLTDPQSSYVKAVAKAYNRKKNYDFATAFFAAVATGKTPSTASTTFSSDMQVAVGFGRTTGVTAGMTLAKWVEAKRLADKYEWPEDDRHICFTGYQLSELLLLTQLTSSDYAGEIRALVNGKINQFLGFTVHRYESLPTDTNSYRRIPFWTSDCMLMAEGMELEINIDRLPDMNYATQVWAGMDDGAIRLEEYGVGEIKCYES